MPAGAVVRLGHDRVGRPARILALMRGHGRYFRPLSEEDQRPIQRKTVRRVIGTFRPYRGKVNVVGLAIVVTAGLGVVNPLLIKAVFNKALFGNPAGVCDGQACPNMSNLYLYAGLMIVIPIVTSIIGIGQTYLANVVGLRVMQDLRDSLYTHLQAMPLRGSSRPRTGEIQSRLANDVGGVQMVVTDTARTCCRTWSWSSAR